MKRELTNPQIHVALCNGIACFVVAELNHVGFSCRICVFSVLPSFQPLVFFLIQNSPSPFCSLGFSSYCHAWRIIMSCMAVGLAQRPTGNSAAVSVRVGFIIIKC